MPKDNAMLAFSYEMPSNDGEKKEVDLQTVTNQANGQVNFGSSSSGSVSVMITVEGYSTSQPTKLKFKPPRTWTV
jgi:hypothetical protein